MVRLLIFTLVVIYMATGCQRAGKVPKSGDLSVQQKSDHEHDFDDAGLLEITEPLTCLKASNAQVKPVNQGNGKYEAFMQKCGEATNGSPWCEQLTRPNPSSRAVFSCTYGESQTHRLIHPDEATWSFAHKAVQLVEELELMGIDVLQIYNWWRPEPYNANVGGAAGRHPYGTSVDVRFNSMPDMERAHSQLCKWRSQGRLRALGYYGSTGLHFGIGDRAANTWGKDCP